MHVSFSWIKGTPVKTRKLSVNSVHGMVFEILYRKLFLADENRKFLEQHTSN